MVSFKCLKSDLETFFFCLNCVSAPAFFLRRIRITTLFIHFDLSKMHAGILTKETQPPKPDVLFQETADACFLCVLYLGFEEP